MESLKAYLERARAEANVALVRETIPVGGIRALCARGAGMENTTIVDARIECQAEVNMLDLHEIIHHQYAQRSHPKVPRNLFAAAPEISDLVERRVDRQVAAIAASPQRIIEAFSEGCRNSYEVAEALEIPEQDLLRAVDELKRQHGSRIFYHNGYRLRFDPFMIEKVS